MNSAGKPKVVAIIQARMGSTRLPGKVLADICGRPMLRHVIERTRRSETLDEVIVATTEEPADDTIAAFCCEHCVSCFRGSEHDVLDRYYEAARRFAAEAIVRITSDCPLIDPEVIDNTARKFLLERPDYASNCLVRTYPRGLDTEIVTFGALERTWREAREPHQRAHVTPYIYENPTRFAIVSLTGDHDYSGHRWTVDTAEDLEFVRALYSRLRSDKFLLADVVKVLEFEPELSEINRSVTQKSLQDC